ncbi:Chromatin-remodeling complex subunit ies6 [Coniochaeta hoffmannii]|uniref:Chromatin-remodeling complex subunit ies6 n=1 Tax=Coniochaeta hoffmannii TaxID=91930 RepID=A0AA38R9J1_9PEZI|nr:Chromatin-remodeling complex subunit ies6 [Coniochaeta hoffmannii]
MSNQTPEQQAATAAHQALIEQLDMHSIHKSFRSPSWRPNQRRNKNIKTILGDATRKEASSSIVATPLPQDNSGAATPAAQGDNDDGLSTSGTSTPAVPSANGAANGGESNLQPNLAQASRSLSKLVLEKSLNGRTNNASGGGLAAAGAAGSGMSSSAPSATYTNIESAPSLAHSRRYCDVTGLPAPYLDPKTRMRYHNSEVFAMIRSLPPGVAEQFLEARGAHTVLK